MGSMMKSLLKIMLILGLALQGAAFAEEWSTRTPSTQGVKANEHGWSVSIRPQFRPFDPIVMPRVVIVPVIRNQNPNLYYRERYDHFQRHYRHLERRFYR